MASRAHPGSLRSRVGDRQTHQPVAPARVAVARAPRARPSHQAFAAMAGVITARGLAATRHDVQRPQPRTGTDPNAVDGQPKPGSPAVSGDTTAGAAGAAESVCATVGATVGATDGVGPTLARTEVSSGRTWFVGVGDAVTPMEGCGTGPGSGSLEPARMIATAAPAAPVATNRPATTAARGIWRSRAGSTSMNR